MQKSAYSRGLVDNIYLSRELIPTSMDGGSTHETAKAWTKILSSMWGVIQSEISKIKYT